MELSFSKVQTSVQFSRCPDSYRLCIGFIDGEVGVFDFSPQTLDAEPLWTYQLKRAVRAAILDETDENAYVLSKNRALSTLDVATGKRTRCIVEAHEHKPSVLSAVPFSNQMLATGDEEGVLKTWDLRADKPDVLCFEDQIDIINCLRMDRYILLSACSDGTLAAFDLRKGKLKAQSETMHSELLSVTANKSYCYVGSGDGVIEVFKGGEYGNIVERFETKLSSVDSMIMLRRGLILAASAQEGDICLFNVNPNKRLAPIGTHGSGVDELSESSDKRFVLSSSMIEQTIKVWDVEAIRQRTPVLTANKAKKIKKNETTESFFAGLAAASSSDNDDDDDDDE